MIARSDFAGATEEATEAAGTEGGQGGEDEQAISGIRLIETKIAVGLRA